MLAYFLGVAACWFTEVLFWSVSGSRASILAMVLLPVEELIRSISGGMYPPRAVQLSVVLAAAAVAAVFPLVLMVFRLRARAAKWIAIVIGIGLVAATLYWPHISFNQF